VEARPGTVLQFLPSGAGKRAERLAMIDEARTPDAAAFSMMQVIRDIGELGGRAGEAVKQQKVAGVTAGQHDLPALRSGRPALRQPCRSEEHTSELQSRLHLVCRLL